MHTLFFTGCRISELGSLKTGSLYEDGGFWVLRFVVKGGKENVVPVHPELYAALWAYLDQVGHFENPKKPLFLPVKTGKNRAGKALHKNHFARIFHHYREAAGLPATFTPHSARATCGTTALENGANLEDVQRMFAHARISTTQIYDRRKHQYKDSAVLVVRH